jgi:hypothetical protein
MLPEVYNLRFVVDEDDPDMPSLQQVYILCFQTVFGRVPKEHNLGVHGKKIVEHARLSNCSIKTYMLANMLGHQRMEADRQAKTAMARASAFSPFRLTDHVSLERARIYAEVCQHEFGSFSLSALSTLSEVSVDDNSIESKMLTSEVLAGDWLLSYKSRYEGPPYAEMYHSIGHELSPYWLAQEDTYKKLVLDNKALKLSQVEKEHRHDVNQAITYMKRHKHVAAAMFKTRQDIMPKALINVLTKHGFSTSDFEIEDKPITNSLEMWIVIGRAVQHWNLIKYLHGESSIF